MGRKALKDRRVFPETQVDLAETQGLKDQSALRVPSVTQVSRAIAVPKDPKDRKDPLGPKDLSVTKVSRAIPALRGRGAPKDPKDLRARRACRGSRA